MNENKLKEILSKIKNPPGVPKGEFCTTDLLETGLSQAQATGFLQKMTKQPEGGPRVVFTQKRQGLSITGDKKWVPYYKMEGM